MNARVGASRSGIASENAAYNVPFASLYYLPVPALSILYMSTASDTTSYSLSSHMSASKSPESEQLQQLLDVGCKILDQALDLLDRSLSSDEHLTTSSKFLPGSTIGKHLRHARDHFALLLDCIVGPQPYVLSYDVRARNTPMETSRKAARDAIEETKKRLILFVPRAELNAPLTLNAITPYEQAFTSTIGREMWFAGLHAVHHWSMIRVIAGELGITLEDNFGYAPSTLVHRGGSGPLATAKI